MEARRDHAMGFFVRKISKTSWWFYRFCLLTNFTS